MQTSIETPRLFLRKISEEDADFLFELMNTKGWLENIGDRNIRSADDALAYIRNMHLANYEKNGFGYFTVTLKNNQTPAGVCGFLNRDTLPGPDIGYAFLPNYTGNGYAYESVSAALHYAKTTLLMPEIFAIVLPGNLPSVKLLDKLGFRFVKQLYMPQDTFELSLYKY